MAPLIFTQIEAAGVRLEQRLELLPPAEDPANDYYLLRIGLTDLRCGGQADTGPDRVGVAVTFAEGSVRVLAACPLSGTYHGETEVVGSGLGVLPATGEILTLRMPGHRAVFESRCNCAGWELIWNQNLLSLDWALQMHADLALCVQVPRGGAVDAVTWITLSWWGPGCGPTWAAQADLSQPIHAGPLGAGLPGPITLPAAQPLPSSPASAPRPAARGRWRRGVTHFGRLLRAGRSPVAAAAGGAGPAALERALQLLLSLTERFDPGDQHRAPRDLGRRLTRLLATRGSRPNHETLAAVSAALHQLGLVASDPLLAPSRRQALRDTLARAQHVVDEAQEAQALSDGGATMLLRAVEELRHQLS